MQYSRPNSRRARLARLRRSLRASTAEGVVAEVVAASTSAAVLTAWALHLGATPSQLGLLVALPSVAQVSHLPAAWLTATIGRRRVAIAAVAASRLVYLGLALVPVLHPGPAAGLALLFAVSGASSVLGIIGNNAWVSWMGELVPERVRGRYFGRRTAICTLGSSLAGLAAGRALDGAGGAHAVEVTLSALALTAAVAGAITTWLMARQQDVAAERPDHLSPRLLVAPLVDDRTRGVFVYAAAWSAANALASGFFALHVLSDVHLGFTLLAAHGAATAALRMLAAPLWGRALDRVGMRPVLVATSLAMSVAPLGWILLSRDRLWPLAVDALLTGVLSSGQSLASFTLPMSMAPRRERPFFTASFALATGLPAAAAAALAAALAGWLPATFAVGGRPFFGLDALFVASAVARLAAVPLAASIVEPGASSLRDARHLATSEVRRAARILWPPSLALRRRRLAAPGN